MGSKNHIPEQPTSREANSCHGCGTGLSGTVHGNDGGLQGRDHEGIEYCRECFFDPDVELLSGPGYGPQACWRADTPDRVRALARLIERGETAHGHPTSKAKQEFGTQEWAAVKELRDRGYKVKFTSFGPVSDEQNAHVLKRSES